MLSRAQKGKQVLRMRELIEQKSQYTICVLPIPSKLPAVLFHLKELESSINVQERATGMIKSTEWNWLEEKDLG